MIDNVGYIQDIKDTYAVVVVPITEAYSFEKKNITECRVVFDDGRTISALQRKKAYAIIRDIADYTGDIPEYIKELLKYAFIEKYGGMTLAYPIAQ